jgi:hypothetical protein
MSNRNKLLRWRNRPRTRSIRRQANLSSAHGIQSASCNALRLELILVHRGNEWSRGRIRPQESASSSKVGDLTPDTPTFPGGRMRAQSTSWRIQESFYILASTLPRKSVSQVVADA